MDRKASLVVMPWLDHGIQRINHGMTGENDPRNNAFLHRRSVVTWLWCYSHGSGNLGIKRDKSSF
ncbi:MAG: hypothetical protein ACRYE8_04600 [Janthinobacterium lividum]